MRVAALHNWPFDPALVDAEMERFEFSESMREQVEECHRSAWVVVLDHDGPANEIEIEQISYVATAREVADLSSRQVAWLEEILVDSPTHSEWVFFLHGISIGGRMFYGDEELTVPEPSPFPAVLGERLGYESP